MATWRRSNHSWSAVKLVRLKIACDITQHLLNEVSVRRTHGLSGRPKPGTVAVLRPAQGWVLGGECG